MIRYDAYTTTLDEYTMAFMMGMIGILFSVQAKRRAINGIASTCIRKV